MQPGRIVLEDLEALRARDEGPGAAAGLHLLGQVAELLPEHVAGEQGAAADGAGHVGAQIGARLSQTEAAVGLLGAEPEAGQGAEESAQGRAVGPGRARQIVGSHRPLRQMVRQRQGRGGAGDLGRPEAADQLAGVLLCCVHEVLESRRGGPSPALPQRCQNRARMAM